MRSFHQLNQCWANQPFVYSEQPTAPHWEPPSGGIGANFTYVYDHINSGYYYLDSAIQDVLGYRADEVKKVGLAFLDKVVHENDRRPVFELLNRVWDFLLSQPTPFRKQYTISIDYRLRHAEGNYIHLIQQNNILTTDSAGNVVYSMGTCFDITHWQKSTPCTLNLYYNNTLLEQWKASPPEAIKTISRREREVVSEVCSGKTSAEVDEKLNISTHTVNTHRKTIMRKLGIKGTPALVQFAHQHQLV